MKYSVEYLINAKCVVILRVVGMNCICDGGGALLKRVKITTLWIFKKSAPRSSQNHTAPLRTPQIYFRTIHFQNNLAASQRVGLVFWFLQIILVESKDVIIDHKHNIQLENIYLGYLFTICNSWTEAIE